MLKYLGENARYVLALTALGAAIGTGLAVFARASEVRELETVLRAEIIQVAGSVLQNEAADMEYRTRQTISQIKAAMRKVIDRTGTDDPLQMGAPDRDDYRGLSDELEYYMNVLEKIQRGEG